MASVLGSTPGIIVGVGVGAAVSTALEPAIEIPKQEAWNRNPNRILDVGLLARLYAQGGVSLDVAYKTANRQGFSDDKLDALIYLAQEAPDLALTLELWRRGRIDETQVDHALAKAQIESQYWGPLKELFGNRLDPAVIAVAIQRGIMKDPGFLPVGPPTAEGNVKAFPVSPLDPLVEATAQGIDEDRLFVETAIVGQPLALVEAAQAYFRGIITIDDFKRAVAEGNTRNEWGDAALEVSRRILSPHDYAELQLRGYLTETERNAGAAKVGMSEADAQLLYDVLGRSIPVHQITTGQARGGVFNGPTDQIPTEYIQSLQRGNLRPEYYNLAYANRYTVPSYFVLRALLQAGSITEMEGEQYFLDLGWPPELAKAAAATYATATTTAVDPNLKKAHTTAWTKTQASYLAAEITETDAAPVFDLLGIDTATRAEIVKTWDTIRALTRKQLTPAQVKKAWSEQVKNPATGQPWTQAEAQAALVDRGYSTADATTFLEE